MPETIENQTVVSIVELKRQADAITTRRTLYVAGAGLIPFPVVDVAALLGVQIFMIRDISRLYEVDFKEQLVKSIITTLVGDLGIVGVMSGVKAIPVVGLFTAPIASAATTYALGKVFTQHFSQGGTLLNFDPVESRKYFQEAFEEGKLYVEDLSKEEEEKSESTGWFKSNRTKELEALRQQNEEMKARLAIMQKSIDALKPA